MNSLRALIIEKSELEADQLLQELEQGGFRVTCARIDTSTGMSAELAARTWDIVYFDFNLTQFNVFEAITLLRETGLDIPLIVVSGTSSENLAVTAMKAGANDYILKDQMKRLVPATRRELEEAKGRRERREADATIRRLAYVDPVTTLPNRARFLELVAKAVEVAKREEDSLALVVMDLERFKEVNDTLGHVRGDELLNLVGIRLKGVLFDRDVVARLGGDEFGILLPHLVATSDLPEIIQKIQASLLEPFLIDDIPIVVEAAIGMATMPQHADDSITLLRLADIAMYRAQQRSSGYAVYEPTFNLYSSERLGLMAELQEAIKSNQLVLQYQPKLELKTHSIVGVEALVRWRHPRRGMLAPGQFVADAERTGLIGPLTRWVMTEALRFCESERSRGNRFRMSVNLSARSLLDSQLVKMIDEVFKASRSAPDRLMLEITESAIILDPKRAEEIFDVLSRIGVGLSIDDFGTGYSSLAGIQRFPIDEVKIDKSFITGVLRNPRERKIVGSLIMLCHDLGLRVVAEGVETKAEYDTLEDLGSDTLQGHYISKPLWSDQVGSWIDASPWTCETSV
ncbi:MAG: EAL domain-containing protein [Planctomycetes bacterium]|nr:EAL domain-containing protein [Planctomycetota bacterium]